MNDLLRKGEKLKLKIVKQNKKYHLGSIKLNNNIIKRKTSIGQNVVLL